MDLKATIYLFDKDNLKAFANLTIGSHFVCKGLKVMDGPNGLWVSMPSKKDKEDNWNDIFHPITKEGRESLFKCVLKAYNKKLKEEGKTESKPALESDVSDDDDELEDIPF